MTDRDDITPGTVHDEVRHHIEMRARELVEQGMAAQQARLEAERQFGDARRVALDCARIENAARRRRGWLDFFAELRQDLTIGARRLALSPAFTLTAVLILAVGIGANSAIFSVVNTVLLQPLPYYDADRLVQVWESAPGRGWEYFAASELNYLDFRDGNDSLTALAAVGGHSVNITGDGPPVRLHGARISANWFEFLGITPMLGRSFTVAEDHPESGEALVMIGHGLWRDRFAGDDNIVGRELVINGVAHAIIGVAPPGLLYFDDAPFYLPMRAGGDTNRGNHMLLMFGRLASGVTIEQAEADLDGVAAQLALDYPDTNAGFDVRVQSLYEALVPDFVRRGLVALLGAVGLVLLIACANLSNLLLARATTRRTEVAICTALGASRGRLMRQHLTESTLLATLGGALGVVLAYYAVNLARPLLASTEIARLDRVGIDVSVLGFALLMAVLTGIIAGAAPAWRATGTDPQAVLRASTRGDTGDRGARRLRDLLLAAEVGLAVVLLTGAGLLIRSLWQVNDVEPGLQTDNVLSFALNMPLQTDADFRNNPALFRTLLERIEALPGVARAGGTSGLPFGDGATVMDFEPEGTNVTDHTPSAGWRLVTPGYQDTLRMPLLLGRWFSDADGENARDEAVISESMANRYWPGESALGKRFHAWRDPERTKTIVGVVGDVRDRSLETAAENRVYMPYYQNAFWATLYVVARTEGPPESVIGDVRTVLDQVAPDKPLSAVMPLAAVRDQAMAGRRYGTATLLAFALVALTLATVGIYGVATYTIGQRVAEIGVRMALGASGPRVVAMVAGQSMAVVGAGAAAGIAGALIGSRFLASMLYGVTPADPVAIGGAALFLVVVAFVAACVPALRATRIDPASVLRAA